MKKILLLLTALFVMGGVEVSARKVDADLSKYTSNWDATNKVLSFSWTTTYGNQLLPELDLPTGDLRAYTKLVVETEEIGNADFFRVLVYNGDDTNNSNTLKVTKTGTMEFDLASNVGNLSKVTKIVLSGSNWEDSKNGTWGTTPASFKVKAVYLEGPDQIEATSGAETPINKMTSYHKDGDTYVTTGYTPNYRINEPTGAAYFGVDWNGENLQNYTDLTGCTSIRVYQNASTPKVRGLFFNKDATGQEVIWFTWNAAGYYELDLAAVQEKVNNLKLISIRPESGQTSSVTKMVVLQPSSKIDYVLSGAGVNGASAIAALNDASATVYDVTGVIGSGIELTSANPNAIFLAEEGTLSNTKNVQIGNTIAKLEITDKKPLADLTGVTATAATYTRSMTNKFGTICLPYAVTSTESVKYYTIDNLDGDVLTLKEETELAAGTPAIVEKVSGESITAEGSGALVAAGAPTGNLELIGTFEEKTVLAADYAGKNIYAIQNNQFVQGLNSITVPAFRAYFTADASAEANLRLAFGDEATAIDSLTGEKSIKAIYSVSGASQASLQKGMNIVEFTDGSVKKVMVK